MSQAAQVCSLSCESWHFFRNISIVQLSLFVDTSQEFMQVPHHSLSEPLHILGFPDTH